MGKVAMKMLSKLRIQISHLRERSIPLHASFKLHFLLFYFGVYIFTPFLKHYIPYFIASKTISRTVHWKSYVIQNFTCLGQTGHHQFKNLPRRAVELQL